MLNCSLCKSSDVKLYLKLNGRVQIYECNTCTNAFTYPAPKPIEYKEKDFHQQFGFNTINDLPSQWKKSLLKQLKLIGKYIKPNGNILEIGCGQGLFLSLLKNEGYSVYGIEPSVKASAIARNNGLNIKTGYFPDENFENVKFDLIIMAQVLEHVEQPIELLKSISDLNKGAQLLLVQTNFKGLVPLKQKKIWYGWVPDQHFWHFTSKGVRNLMRSLNLKTVEIEYSTLEHNNYWLSKLTSIIPNTGDQLHAIIKL
ncbi:class I SAM-dependent methyltransferase [Pedobacter fastidiosus]|uniref:Class I SAM-dependent methyltransferase n=1 Tax=Pedobacter fastidiosus TaxID=2765361 RepID=A0ABR7KVS8_9SPHI|nr:class I SAM-dependent methyltransferase [Pedobacter fastidiosus]MBC6112172.1 class I SAM-dependent methyltransferase [Pedobacter fastidiosus]